MKERRKSSIKTPIFNIYVDEGETKIEITSSLY